MGSRGAADVDLPSPVADRDHAEVLAQGLGTVARAPGDRQFEFRGGLEALEPLFDGDAQRGGVAEPEAAEVAADTGFHGPHALAVGVPGWHVQVAPHLGQVFLPDTEQVDALSAGHFHQGDAVLVGDVRDPPELVGGGDTALHLRYHGERAVALDVGMHAVVDEEGAAFVHPVRSPDHPQQRRERHLGGGVLRPAGGERREHLRHRPQILVSDRLHQFGFGHRNARHVPVGRRIDGQRTSRGARDDVADEPRARSAALARAGRPDHLGQRRRTAVDARDDVAFRDAVAVAHLRVVGQFGRAGLRTGSSHVEQHVDALGGQRDLVVERLCQEVRLTDVAEKHGPDELVVSHDHGLVRTAAWFVELDELVGVALGTLDAHRGDVHSGHLELRGRSRTVIRRSGIHSAQDVGEHGRLLPQRRHQPVHLPAMLTALTDRVDGTLVLAAHLVVDDDAALDHQPASSSEVDVGPDAGRDDDHVGGQCRAVRERHSGDVTGRAAQHGGGPLRRVHTDAEGLDLGAQHPPTAFVELLIHQVPGGVHDIDVDAPSAETVRGLEPEQATADDDGAHTVARRGHLQHAVGVLDGPEPEHAAGETAVALPQPVHVGKERRTPGRDDQRVVRHRAPALARDRLREPVHPDGPVADVQRHAVLAVPRHGVEHEVVVVDGGRTGEDVREHDAVVVAVGLVADHGDVEQLSVAPQDLLDGARTGHPVADHHQPRASGRHQKTIAPKSTTTSPRHPSGAATVSSRTESGSTSSTTRNGMLTPDFAPIGNTRMDSPSRVRVTTTSSSDELPPRK